MFLLHWRSGVSSGVFYGLAPNLGLKIIMAANNFLKRETLSSLAALARRKIWLGLAWRTSRSRNVEQEAVISIFHLYTPLMSSKRKGRSSTASQSSNQSPKEKRRKNSETDEVFEALEMAEDFGLKLQRLLDKLEKLDKIEAHLTRSLPVLLVFRRKYLI